MFFQNRIIYLDSSARNDRADIKVLSQPALCANLHGIIATSIVVRRSCITGMASNRRDKHLARATDEAASTRDASQAIAAGSAVSDSAVIAAIVSVSQAAANGA